MLPGNSLHLFLLHVVSLCFFFSFKGAPSLSVALQWSVIQNSENSLKECVFFCTKALSENVGVGGMTKKR